MRRGRKGRGAIRRSRHKQIAKLLFRVNDLPGYIIYSDNYCDVPKS